MTLAGGNGRTEDARERERESKHWRGNVTEGMEWMDEMDDGGDREESGHRIFEGGNDLACTFSEGGTPRRRQPKFMRRQCTTRRTDAEDYFSARKRWTKGDSAIRSAP